jgi:hypothetical protein
MIFISHRGNIDGREIDLENQPEYISNTLKKGYDVEIDIWVIKNKIYLGHDMPQYLIDEKWLIEKKTAVWIHCKNIECVEFFADNKNDFNYFWHENDTVTLTSKGHIWAFPGKQPIKKSVAVLPELYNDNLDKCSGICSDFIRKFKILKS